LPSHTTYSYAQNPRLVLCEGVRMGLADLKIAIAVVNALYEVNIQPQTN
jgi:hypothetical protein